MVPHTNGFGFAPGVPLAADHRTASRPGTDATETSAEIPQSTCTGFSQTPRKETSLTRAGRRDPSGSSGGKSWLGGEEQAHTEVTKPT
jgi:hypothetical protein